LAQLYSSIYDSNKRKYISQAYLNMLDEIGFATWILDDGSYDAVTDHYSLATDCFNYEEHLLMQQFFKEKWNIDARIHNVSKRKTKQYRLSFRKKDTVIIRQMLYEIVKDIPAMKYKIRQPNITATRKCGELIECQ
jgi:hypothetical protein